MIVFSKFKSLSDAGWKDVAAKNKVKDNGLLKVLGELKKCGEEQHDEAAKLLEEVVKLAGLLKKDKTIAAVPLVGKYITEIVNAAESSVRDVVKARAEFEKAQKAKTDADKKTKAEAAKKSDDDDDDDDESPALLTTKMLPLLRLVLKGQAMYALVAKSGKQVAVMLSRKAIPPARRKMLADQLGGGSTKYFPGQCTLEAGAVTFILSAEVAGLAKLIKLALYGQTGMRVNKVRCRGEDGSSDDGDDDGDTPPDAAPQPEGGADADHKLAAPTPELRSAPQAWRGTLESLQTSIDLLKAGIQAQLGDEDAAFVEAAESNLKKLDRVMGRLDQRLSVALARAGDANDAQARDAALQESKAIVSETIRYVSSEPLIDHLDNNPFGVETNLKATLAKSLTQLVAAIS